MKRTSSAVELFLRIDKTGQRVDARGAVERELRRAIQSGRLGHGAPLPSTRALASDSGLSRGVVVEAYEQLLAEGYLSAHRGSATRVSGRRHSGRRDACEGGLRTNATARLPTGAARLVIVSTTRMGCRHASRLL